MFKRSSKPNSFKIGWMQKLVARFRRLFSFANTIGSAPMKVNSFARLWARFWKFTEPDWSKAPKTSLFETPNELKRSAYINPVYWFFWISRFLGAWFISRPYASVGPAIPAIGVLIFLGSLLFWEKYQGNRWRTTLYKQIMLNAAQAKDFETAAVACRTLINISPFDSGLRYQQAMFEEKAGNKDLCNQIMADLAIRKEYGDAALWLLGQFEMKGVTQWPKEKHHDFQILIDIASKKLDANKLDSAKLIKASYLTQMGAVRDAMQLIAEVAPRNGDVNTLGVGLAVEAGNLDAARQFAANAEKHLRQAIASSPMDVRKRIDLAKALVFLEREDEALAVLHDGYELTKDESLKDAMAETKIRFCRRIYRADKPSETLVVRLKNIRDAMNIAPNNSQVIDAIIEVVLECQENKNNQVAVLRESILKGAAPEATHFIQGTLALLDGDTVKAMSHLELAQTTGVNTPGLLNNLAMAFLESGTSELETAHRFANAAVEKLPNHPYLRDTRGRILMQMKDYSKAIPDLELALQAPELAKGVHELLADAYAAIGQQEMAESHRKLSQNALKPK